MPKITNTFDRSGFMGHGYDLSAISTLANGVTANAPTYEQVNALRADIIDAGGAYASLPKPFEDFSDIIESVDTTEHNFYDMLRGGPRPRDMEYRWNQEDINSLEVESTNDLQIVTEEVADSGSFTFAKGSSSGDDASVYPLSSLIDINSQVGMKIRSGHILQNISNNSYEQLLVMDLGTDGGADGPTKGLGSLVVCRAGNIGGRISGTAAKIPTSATTAHPAGSKFRVANLITSEMNLAPKSFRSGFKTRMNLIQIVDFSISKGFLESLFQIQNQPGHFRNPTQHARNIHELQFYEVWNRIALFGVPGRTNINGIQFYASGGLLHYIKRYCTEAWAGASDATYGGFYPIEADTTNIDNYTNYKCNGDSNYRVGDDDPDTPIAFGESMLNELNDKVISKLGSNGKNDRFIPNMIIGPRSFRRVFGQFTEDRLRVSKQMNATGGYFADSYITDNGNVLRYVVDNSLGNRILIGNSMHGMRRPLLTLALYKPPVQTRNETFWFTSIQGFQWDYPEYAWGLWENVVNA